jgi:group I intron endonuclease
VAPKYNIQKIADNYLGQKRSEITKALISKVKSGLIHFAETKLKISESFKGKTHSEKTKTKVNLAKIGEKNPNFGKVHSAESKVRMSVARGTAILYT